MEKCSNIKFAIVTKYSNVISYSRTLGKTLVIADKKTTHIKLTVKWTTENIWRSDQENAYIRVLSKQKCPW